MLERWSLPKLIQFKCLLYLNYLEERKGHLHGMLRDFTDHSLKHEFQSAAKNVFFLLVHTFEDMNFSTFPQNYLVFWVLFNVLECMKVMILKKNYTRSLLADGILRSNELKCTYGLFSFLWPFVWSLFL